MEYQFLGIHFEYTIDTNSWKFRAPSSSQSKPDTSARQSRVLHSTDTDTRASVRHDSQTHEQAETAERVYARERVRKCIGGYRQESKWASERQQ
jgi:hypothetical protein